MTFILNENEELIPFVEESVELDSGNEYLIAWLLEHEED